MELEYRRNLRQSFLIVTPNCPGIEYQTEMCRRNKIPGLLEMETVIADGKLQFWYDITGRQSLEEYLKDNKMDYELLKELVYAVFQITGALFEYLLDEEGLLLQPALIYVGSARKDVTFCYCREARDDLQTSFGNLMEYLLTKLNHSDERAVAAGYEAYQRTLKKGYDIAQIWNVFMTLKNPEPPIQISEMKEENKPERKVEKQSEKKKREWQISFLMDIRAKMTEHINEVKNKLKKPRKRVEERIFTPEQVMEQENSYPTVFLGEQTNPESGTGMLVYQGSEKEEDLILDKSPFLIGSISGQGLDGVIQRGGVSRMHAKITKEGELYYLEDMNSTNGTIVNGALLNYMEHVPLQDGDEVLFGEAEYLFSVSRKNYLD